MQIVSGRIYSMVAFYIDKATVQKSEKRCRTGTPINTTNKEGRIYSKKEIKRIFATSQFCVELFSTLFLTLTGIRNYLKTVVRGLDRLITLWGCILWLMLRVLGPINRFWEGVCEHAPRKFKILHGFKCVLGATFRIHTCKLPSSFSAFRKVRCTGAQRTAQQLVTQVC